jgi:hypothetical protein
MRSYPHNSPEAAGRVLALLLIADGNVCASEIDALNRLGAERQLGLRDGGLGVLLRDLCEDLLMGGHYSGSLLDGLDGAALRSMMEEVSDLRLRSEVLTLARAAARADEHLAEGEAFVLGAACRYWSLSPQHLATPAMPA